MSPSIAETIQYLLVVHDSRDIRFFYDCDVNSDSAILCIVNFYHLANVKAKCHSRALKNGEF